MKQGIVCMQRYSELKRIDLVVTNEGTQSGVRLVTRQKGNGLSGVRAGKTVTNGWGNENA